MFRQFLSLLLVPLLLGSQAFVWEHSHRGTDVDEPQGHATRPHFHVGGHEHRNDAQREHNSYAHHHDSRLHDHSPGERLHPNLRSTIAHDANAIYGPHAVTLARNKSADPVCARRAAVSSKLLHESRPATDVYFLQALMHLSPPSISDAFGPIYLRTLSLRI